MFEGLSQKELQEFIDRRHPEYDAKAKHWCFMQATYAGGREWFEGNIFRNIKEGDVEYNKRMERVYRFNHTREIVDLIQKYIFKSPVSRSGDAPEEVRNFWKDATKTGLDIDQFMKLVASESSQTGLTWVFMDSTKTSEIQTKKEEKEAKARVYAYTVRPEDILDGGFDEYGALNWLKVREWFRDDASPTSSGTTRVRYRIWTKHEWCLFEEREDGSTRKKDRRLIVKIGEGDNELGMVPGFPVFHMLGENQFSAPGLIDDIAYLDRAVANYLSNIDEIIQGQTFSQLVMPAQGKLPGDDDYDQLLEMGVKRIFVYDGEGGAAPQYISPDVKQAQLIVVVINKIINEIYHTVGMAGERTKQDNAVGIDNSSGVAKAYDFERLNSLLTTKSQSLAHCENRLITLVAAWHKSKAPKDDLVKYADTFDVRSLFDEFTVAERLANVGAPDEIRREQMRQVRDKLFPTLVADLKKKMEADILKWSPSQDAKDQAQAKMNAAKAKPQSRQGQVTAATA